jgi:hypothetical protein
VFIWTELFVSVGTMATIFKVLLCIEHKFGKEIVSPSNWPPPVRNSPKIQTNEWYLDDVSSTSAWIPTPQRTTYVIFQSCSWNKDHALLSSDESAIIRYPKTP